MGADQTVTGRVVQEMPNGIYQVELEGGQSVRAHPAGGKIRNFVRLLPGDRVEVKVAAEDATRARIVRKLA